MLIHLEKCSKGLIFQIILLALVAAETTPVPLGWSTKHEAQS